MQVITFSGVKLEPYINPEDARMINVKLAASTTFAKGTVLGQVSATGVYDKYADAGAGGLDVARGILAYDCVTDADGNITLGAQAASEFGNTLLAAPMYYKGTFLVGDLTGLTAAAVADLGRLITGAVTDNDAILSIG